MPDIAELIREQLQINIQDGLVLPRDLDVGVNEQWATVSCSYRDGVITVTNGENDNLPGLGVLRYAVKIERVN